ncbi:putative meiotically up-regulated gene 80 protein [Mollisia scopiformis]|uniref:Putative meiotically up-regulated gene 80 protein n=1 Tax=Mollisia scopiformis TaxID=149040 RepID=A0A132B6K5_MOLSC|nr:putative meiotically up-regulated gene 80 protein [Mollisia scopiformis]KUJ08035.1 putative meiotically up-regulated gene 80 protein [Mollisia scopiformis]
MASGGVCAVLDYEIDQMTEYVAEMAQRIVLPTSPVSPAFRKFVSGLLSSTRLPSTTILLGMNYLARRMNILNAAGGLTKSSDGNVWRMLTIGLLLGSKFLDDNTFQNRSWSEAMGWSLYVNLETSDDFQAWLQSWAEWRETKNMQRKATLERLAPMPLAPIDTNVQRPRQYSHNYNGYIKTASHERPESGYQSAYDQTAWINNSYPTPHLTPPSAPDSGLNTPEYMSATGGPSRYNDWSVFNSAARAAYQPQTYATYIPSHHLAGYHTPFIYHNGYANPSIWDHVPQECGCHECHPYAKQQHFMGHGYHQQILA